MDSAAKHRPHRPKKPKKTLGAPGPIVGVGLPILLVAGAGAIWLVRRRRDQSAEEGQNTAS
jgi:hypothetical protein